VSYVGYDELKTQHKVSIAGWHPMYAHPRGLGQAHLLSCSENLALHSLK
jgi:hypothetical protein